MTDEPANLNKPLYAYCHIGCVGGKSLIRYLRQSYGMKHLDVVARDRKAYSSNELNADLMAAPFIESIAGHTLRPYSDLSDSKFRLRWYAIFRDPISRMLSHYQQQFEHPSRKFEGTDLLSWVTKLERYGWQTRIIAGTNDANRAFEILSTRFDAIGINESFEESLFLFREKLGLRIEFHENRNRGPYPPENAESKQRILDEYNANKDQIDELYGPEIELYQRVKNELFQQQVNQYGGLKKLETDLRTYLDASSTKSGNRSRYYVGRIYNKFVHPINRAARG